MHRFRPTRKVKHPIFVARYGSECARAVAIVQVLGGSGSQRNVTELGKLLVQCDKSVRVRVSRLAKQHSVYDTEHRRVDPDAQSERDYSDRSETGTLAGASQRIA